MDLETRLRKELERGGPGEVLEWETEGVTFRVQLTDVDRLACVVDGLAVATAMALPPERVEARLRQQADRICETVTYLAENFRLVECLPGESVAQLRSFLPETSDEAIRYFEIMLYGGQRLSLQRYRYDKTARERQTEGFALTRNTLVRLLGDLAKVVQE
jgi:hypothetical protein